MALPLPVIRHDDRDNDERVLRIAERVAERHLPASMWATFQHEIRPRLGARDSLYALLQLLIGYVICPSSPSAGLDTMYHVMEQVARVVAGHEDLFTTIKEMIREEVGLDVSSAGTGPAPIFNPGPTSSSGGLS